MTDELRPETYERWRRSRLGNITEALERQAVAAMLPESRGMTVLDAGCGDGTYAIEAADRGALVTALDFSFPMLVAARRRLGELQAKVRCCQGDILSLPFADCSFDVVLTVTTLCSIKPADQAVRELARVLKPGGVLVIRELGRWSTWAAGRRIRSWFGARFWQEVHFWTFGKLRRLVSACGLVCTATRGAIYYPPCAPAARLLSPWDQKLLWLGSFGAAFLLIRAEKCPLESPRTLHGVPD